MPKGSPVLPRQKKYLVPVRKLADYEFPEELAFWAFKLAGQYVHSNTHSPIKKSNVDILDPIGRLIGTISYRPPSNGNVCVTVVDKTPKEVFIKAIDTYLVDVLGINIITVP